MLCYVSGTIVFLCDVMEHRNDHDSHVRWCFILYNMDVLADRNMCCIQYNYVVLGATIIVL